MSALFPFDLPGPTAFYLILLVLTFALHQAFMHYVLAGSLYVAWATLFPIQEVEPLPGPRNERHQSLSWILRDWMPFLLSAAITAGVAPLLFIQIVYQKQFYTSNLLLSWRWMIVVPVLIVAFYLLYLLKSQIMTRWPRVLRAGVVILTAGCFVFVGFCWTANHLIGMSESKWAEIYLTGQLPLVAASVLSRMLLWISGAFATMTAIVSWQLQYHQLRNNSVTATETPAKLVVLALGGLGVLIVAASLCFIQSSGQSREIVTASSATPYLKLAALGVALQFVGWLGQSQFTRFQTRWLALISSGGVLSLLSVSFLREAIRANTIDLQTQFPKHAAAAEIGGFPLFLFFTVVVSLTIAWCFRIVRQGLQHADGDTSEGAHESRSTCTTDVHIRRIK